MRGGERGRGRRTRELRLGTVRIDGGALANAACTPWGALAEGGRRLVVEGAFDAAWA